jgi:hypothetical protein
MCVQSIMLVHLCRLELGWGAQVDDTPSPREREREPLAPIGKPESEPLPS